MSQKSTFNTIVPWRPAIKFSDRYKLAEHFLYTDILGFVNFHPIHSDPNDKQESKDCIDTELSLKETNKITMNLNEKESLVNNENTNEVKRDEKNISNIKQLRTYSKLENRYAPSTDKQTKKVTVLPVLKSMPENFFNVKVLPLIKINKNCMKSMPVNVNDMEVKNLAKLPAKPVTQLPVPAKGAVQLPARSGTQLPTTSSVKPELKLVKTIVQTNTISETREEINSNSSSVSVNESNLEGKKIILIKKDQGITLKPLNSIKKTLRTKPLILGRAKKKPKIPEPIVSVKKSFEPIYKLKRVFLMQTKQVHLNDVNWKNPKIIFDNKNTANKDKILQKANACNKTLINVDNIKSQNGDKSEEDAKKKLNDEPQSGLYSYEFKLSKDAINEIILGTTNVKNLKEENKEDSISKELTENNVEDSPKKPEEILIKDTKKKSTHTGEENTPIHFKEKKESPQKNNFTEKKVDNALKDLVTQHVENKLDNISHPAENMNESDNKTFTHETIETPSLNNDDNEKVTTVSNCIANSDKYLLTKENKYEDNVDKVVRTSPVNHKVDKPDNSKSKQFLPRPIMEQEGDMFENNLVEFDSLLENSDTFSMLNFPFTSELFNHDPITDLIADNSSLMQKQPLIGESSGDAFFGEKEPQRHVNKLQILFFEDMKCCLDRDFAGNMPVHVAVIKENMKAIHRQCLALLARIKTTDIRNNDGMTPLHLAIVNRANPDIISILLRYEASVIKIDSDGNNAFHLAAYHPDVEIVRRLLEYSCGLEEKIDTTNFDGFTPLIISVINNDYVIVEQLLLGGFSPNNRDQKSGRSALFHAVELNNPRLVELLLVHGADPRIENYVGISAHDAVYELSNLHANVKFLILEDQKKRRKSARKRRSADDNNKKKDIRKKVKIEEEV